MAVVEVVRVHAQFCQHVIADSYKQLASTTGGLAMIEGFTSIDIPSVDIESEEHQPAPCHNPHIDLEQQSDRAIDRLTVHTPFFSNEAPPQRTK